MSSRTSSSRVSHRAPAKAELVGIEWLDLNPTTNSVPAIPQKTYSENTVYSPAPGTGVIFDITPEKFEVAAGFDFQGFNLVDQSVLVEASLTTSSALDINDYYILGSANTEGYAKDANNDGYAESFFTDEVEIFLGLVNDQGDSDPTNDEIVGSVEVEIDFARKVDILLNGGLDIDDIFANIGGGNLLSLVEEIGIKYQANNPADPLMSGFVIPFAEAVAGFVANGIPQLANLIELEAGDVNPSKWASGAFERLVITS